MCVCAGSSAAALHLLYSLRVAETRCILRERDGVKAKQEEVWVSLREAFGSAADWRQFAETHKRQPWETLAVQKPQTNNLRR